MEWSSRRFSLCQFILIVSMAMVIEASAALALERPTGRVILEVVGKISMPNDGDARAVFDREMLEELGVVEVVTDTPWTEGQVRFEGVLIRDLLMAVGAEGTSVRATAINDYAIDIPIEDFHTHRVILAMKTNGKYMRVREKGPLWVIYPWQENPDLRTEIYHSRSIWQLKRIRVD